MDPTAAEALDQLNQLGQHGGLLGPCHVLTFCGLRQAKGGAQQEVTVDILDKVYQTGRKYAADFKETMRIVFDDVLPKWNYRAIPSGP